MLFVLFSPLGYTVVFCLSVCMFMGFLQNSYSVISFLQDAHFLGWLVRDDFAIYLKWNLKSELGSPLLSTDTQTSYLLTYTPCRPQLPHDANVVADKYLAWWHLMVFVPEGQIVHSSTVPQHLCVAWLSWTVCKFNVWLPTCKFRVSLFQYKHPDPRAAAAESF